MLGLKGSCYAPDSDEHKKAKGMNRSLVATIGQVKYIYATINKIKSKNNKIYIQNNGYDGSSELIIKKNKNIILIFSLVRRAFLSSYKNIILIFL